jgi:uncharacterized protein YjiS (DUF1127 family)
MPTHFTFQTIDNAPVHSTFVERSFSLLRTLPTRIAKYAARRRARDELNQLSDYELADIGLSRGQIHSAVYGRTK